MKAIKSNTEKLVIDVNYFIGYQETWNGKKWKSYNADIGNTSFMCTSLEELKNSIKNFHFETKEDRERTERAISQFGTNS